MNFLVEGTAISGTVRATMTLADALGAKIVTTGAPVTWRSSRAEWLYVEDFREFTEPAYTSADVQRLGPVVDDEVYRDRLPREHEPLRVLLAGASHKEAHGISDGYGAVAHARWFHQTLELVRVSPWTPSREEPLEAVQEFHVALTTAEMTRLLHSCDVFLAPNRREDAYPLIAAEAMAAGLACVFTQAIAFGEDGVLSAPEDNAVELGERLIEILGEAPLRLRLRKRARALAENFRVAHALARL
ncbi:MAG TPA: glycosyltransferase [Thermoanaerobaculia bacterium]|nr:glycosyltransferase [Thermoanaerobaculia bacterium]